MRSVGIIPARYGSTRLPAKPLIKIADRCLLEWVVLALKDKTELDELVVATDHLEIARLADSLGVKAVMTDSELPSGTDRVFAASKESSAEVVLNIQGDEPLVQAAWVNSVLRSFQENPEVQMATVSTALEVSEAENPNVVKVLTDRFGDAIYFSRFNIPYSRQTMSEWPGLSRQHIGLYGFRREFLKAFCGEPRSELEQAESLEQLRALNMGAKIRVLDVSGKSIGIDTPEDVKKLELILRSASHG